MTAASILILLSAGLVVGFAAGWARAKLGVPKRQTPGFAGSDMGWPGKPLRFIDADEIDAALRGDA